jgi:DNA repair protein RadC
MDEKISIKHWAINDRPRERLLLNGIHSLSDSELIAILLRTGTKKITAVELARQLLVKVENNLNKLGKLSVSDLMKLKGIGEAKAITLVAALELGKRRKLAENPDNTAIKCSKDIFEIFHALLSDLPHEEFWVLMLNRSNRIIEKVKISQGGVAGTVIDKKLILRIALENLASSIVLCHNHPSGNLNPSQSDIEITNHINDAAKLMDIKMLDHIIIADKGYFSFLDEGLLM